MRLPEHAFVQTQNSKCQQLININPDGIVTIGADPEAIYDTVVQVVDVARAAGVRKYVLSK
jgi:biopolymer transport protein ExbD